MDVCSLRLWFLFWLDESVLWVCMVLSAAAAVSCGRVVLAARTAGGAAAVADVVDVCPLRLLFLFWLDNAAMWVWCYQ